jgi:xylan 1,4-beta-xylosidase
MDTSQSINIYQITNPSPNPVKLFLPVCSVDPLCSNDVCDPSLPMEQRALALVNAMTLEEKADNMVHAAPGVGRLGLPPYDWWSEALHGVAGSPAVEFQSPLGSNFSFATSFPMPILMSASFDDALIHAVGTTVGTEARAFANYGFAGLDFWTPNINPFRDPRWGRGMETPGEDPYRIQQYVYNLVTGLQGGVDPADKLVISTCKHFAAYDIEQTRETNSVDPTEQDLSEYYLPSFKSCIRDARGSAIMCSYTAVYGIPSCANEYLLQTVLREQWNFSAPYNWVVSDCDAVEYIYSYHDYVDNIQAAAAVALNAGTDLNCGGTYENLPLSVTQNMTTEATLDRSLVRLYSSLIQMGWFGGESEYNSLSWADVGTSAAQSLAYQAAVEGITLLKNDGTLPLLSSISNVAVIGPWANATTQMQGNYYGTPPYLISPLMAFTKNWPGVQYELGTNINDLDTSGFAAALAAANSSEYIIVCAGIDTSIEAEGMDRTSISYPGNQLELISQLSQLGKKLVVVRFGGGSLDDTELLENQNVNALVWAGYPGQDGGNALYDILTGKASVAGRLPVTQYPADYVNEVSIFDMNLRPNGDFPGRTYKWYNTPVIPFGYGLHYTTFSFSWVSTPKTSYNIGSLIESSTEEYTDLSPFAQVVARVTNTGGLAGLSSDYVGLLFVSTEDAGPAPYPNKSLAAYGRLHDIAIGDSQDLKLSIYLGCLARADTDGNLVLYPGSYTLTFDIDSKLSFNFTLSGKATVIENFPQSPPNVTPFEYLGCYSDVSGTTSSVLSATSFKLSSNEPQLCVDTCADAGWHYAGVKDGQ